MACNRGDHEVKTWFAAATAPTNPGDVVPALGAVEAMGARDSIVGAEGVAEVTRAGSHLAEAGGRLAEHHQHHRLQHMFLIAWASKRDQVPARSVFEVYW